MSEQDPKAWFGGVPRVMFVHAHPDDETIATGGTLAALAEAGLEPLLLTLTRGEQGEVYDGPFRHLQGTDALAPHRQQELAAALAMLGVERHVFLGVPPARAAGLPPTIYEDSGMEWEPASPDASDDAGQPSAAVWSTEGADPATEPGLASQSVPHEEYERHGSRRAVPASTVGPDALTSVPAVEVLNDVLAAAHDSHAGAIVSYDDGGGYGHPDHVLAHRLARAVAQALELPFWEIVSDVDGTAPDVSVSDSDAVDGTADPDQSPVEQHDIAAWMDRKVAALRMHGTQVAVDGSDIVHVGGQREPIARVESFRRR
ncbi:PIG-L family deacetylase [Leucobacter sp. GX24907]